MKAINDYKSTLDVSLMSNGHNPNWFMEILMKQHSTTDWNFSF